MTRFRPFHGPRALWLLLPALLLGCNDAIGAHLRGTYDMTTFGGRALPSTVEFTGGSMTVYSAQMELGNNQRFELSMHREICTPTAGCADEEIIEEGMYSVVGGVFVLLMDRGGRLDGSVEGDTITIYDVNPGSTWVRRQ